MYNKITTIELANLLKNDKINLIDVREVYERQFGYIKESINIQMNQLAMEYNKHLDKNKVYYIICQSGSRSNTICQYLSSKGYQVINISGGHSAWSYEMER